MLRRVSRRRRRLEPTLLALGLLLLLIPFCIYGVYAMSPSLVTLTGTVVSTPQITTLEPSDPNLYYVFEFKVESSSDTNVFHVGETVKWVWMRTDKFDPPKLGQRLTITGYWSEVGAVGRKEGYLIVESVETEGIQFSEWLPWILGMGVAVIAVVIFLTKKNRRR